MTTTTQKPSALPTPYALIPSIVLAFVNSEQGKDIEKAHALCLQHGIDYQATRREIIVRAVQESERIAAARPEKGKKAGVAPSAPHAAARGRM